MLLSTVRRSEFALLTRHSKHEKLSIGRGSDTRCSKFKIENCRRHVAFSFVFPWHYFSILHDVDVFQFRSSHTSIYILLTTWAHYGSARMLSASLKNGEKMMPFIIVAPLPHMQSFVCQFAKPVHRAVDLFEMHLFFHHFRSFRWR